MKKTINLKTISILVLLLSFVSYANAVDIPTVDDLNKQVPQLPSEKKPDASESLGKTDEKVLEKDEEKILKLLVKDFKINGNKKYDDKILKDLVKESINQELDYDALLKVTTIISNYYRSEGFLATAYLPPQDIKNGVVEIKITEAVLGKITFNVDEGQKLNISRKNKT